MARRSLPFEFTRRGYRCNLDPDERHLLRRLIGEVRELLSTTTADDAKMSRLFPPAYLDDVDTEAQSEYEHFMRDELVASRLEAIMRVDEFLAEEGTSEVSAEDLDAFSRSLNSVRLVLGTLLDIDGQDDDESPAGNVGHPNEMNLYNYLSWLLECAIAARMKGWDSEHRKS
ncbi:MAG: DUF2017 family protein [Ilumatobacteraceae bacterium]